MTINTSKALSNSKTQKMAFLRKAIFLSFLFCYSSASAKEIHVALIDTSFCPSLIKTSQNIIIDPVKDFTQSHSFKCYKGILKKRAFHGHWVLETIVKGLNPQTPIRITPLIVFNKKGSQKLSYWKRALAFIEEANVDFAIAAAGLPLIEKNDLLSASSLKTLSKPLLLATGRKGPYLTKEVPLFPHIHRNWPLFYFGSFHEGLDSQDPARSDKMQFSAYPVHYSMPFQDKRAAYPSLKGSSLSVSLGARYLLEKCLSELSNKENLSKGHLSDCFERGKVLIKGKATSFTSLKE